MMMYIDKDGTFQKFGTMWIVVQDTKPPKSSARFQVEQFGLRPKWKMKKMSLVFLEKNELQHRENSIQIALLGIPSI